MACGTPVIAYNEGAVPEIIEDGKTGFIVDNQNDAVAAVDCGSGEKFRDQTYPLFARYLKGQGVDPENPKYVVVAVFFKDRCHLLEGREFFRILHWLAE
jgi:glycosyltransferase involved in cell wall biosynthesis